MTKNLKDEVIDLNSSFKHIGARKGQLKSQQHFFFFFFVKKHKVFVLSCVPFESLIKDVYF